MARPTGIQHQKPNGQWVVCEHEWGKCRYPQRYQTSTSNNIKRNAFSAAQTSTRTRTKKNESLPLNAEQVRTLITKATKDKVLRDAKRKEIPKFSKNNKPEPLTNEQINALIAEEKELLKKRKETERKKLVEQRQRKLNEKQRWNNMENYGAKLNAQHRAQMEREAEVRNEAILRKAHTGTRKPAPTQAELNAQARREKIKKTFRNITRSVRNGFIRVVDFFRNA